MNEMNTVSDWVRDQYARAELFEKLGIDFCCKGNRSLQAACEDKQLSVKEVMKQLKECKAQVNDVDCRSMNITELCDHIEHTHHAYLKKIIPSIKVNLEKIVKAHGESYFLLKETFEKLASELEEHMKKEEENVFPLLRLADSKAARMCVQLEEEHDEAGNLLASIRTLTCNFALDPSACMTHQRTWSQLKELEEDMHLHVFKENYLLFPMARKIAGVL